MMRVFGEVPMKMVVDAMVFRARRMFRINVNGHQRKSEVEDVTTFFVPHVTPYDCGGACGAMNS